MGYYDSRDLNDYWYLASHYVLADRFFSSAMGGSSINHQYWVAAQGSGFGDSIPAAGIDQTTIFDRLEQAGISWKFYVKNYDSQLNFRYIVPGDPRDSQLAWIPLLTMPKFVDSPTRMAKIQELSNLYSDLVRADAPAVSYIIQGGTSEHPPGQILNGEISTMAIIDAIMRSSLWSSSAIILTWDDWGGWYDHVPPPQVDSDGYGFRVPALIVSPFAKSGYVFHETADFTSILKFVERLHGLAPLTSRDEQANDLLNAFDFAQPPRRPEIPPSGPPSSARSAISTWLLADMYAVVGALAVVFLIAPIWVAARRRKG
jgi:phospholipase C